jgi:uncharacterized protein YbcI
MSRSSGTNDTDGRGPLGLTDAISAAIVNLYTAFYAHDRTTATTYINDNVVVCVLEDILTENEFVLVAAGARDTVIDGLRALLPRHGAQRLRRGR